MDGYVFDSKKESRRYRELALLEKAGKIEKLVVHPRFMLQPAFFAPLQEKRIRAVSCTWDFAYVEDGREVVEDVKSEPTRKEAAYNIRKRWFIKMFPSILFREVV